MGSSSMSWCSFLICSKLCAVSFVSEHCGIWFGTNCPKAFPLIFLICVRCIMLDVKILWNGGLIRVSPKICSKIDFDFCLAFLVSQNDHWAQAWTDKFLKKSSKFPVIHLGKRPLSVNPGWMIKCRSMNWQIKSFEFNSRSCIQNDACYQWFSPRYKSWHLIFVVSFCSFCLFSFCIAWLVRPFRSLSFTKI